MSDCSLLRFSDVFLSPGADTPTAPPRGQEEAPFRPVKGVPKLKLAIGSDHAGFPLKRTVIDLLRFWGHEVSDVGTFSQEPVDFPDIVCLVCSKLKSGWADRGILLGGSGVGACIAANKVRGIRAALCHDTFSAAQCVEHDDVNVLCMGAWIIGPKTMEQVVDAFLRAQFSTEEHFRRRVEKIDQMDQRF